MGRRGEKTEARDAALANLRQIRERILEGMSFDDAARTYSEDPYTKVSGGDTGWHHRADTELPAEIIDAAFAAEIQGLSEPIETPLGYYLVRVVAIEPEPNDATLKFRMQQTFARSLRTQILTDAKIKLQDDSTTR